MPAGAIHGFIEQRAKEMPPLPEARSLRFLRPALERWLSLDPEERPSADELADALSVLTAPEERRARRWRIARWLAPLLMTLAAVFGVVVHQLSERAADRAREAQLAHRAAADARADLIVADARQRALEEGNAALRDRYEQGRLSRRQLAGELATTEHQLGIVRRELGSALADRNAARERVTTTEETLRQREGELASARELADTRGRALDTARDELRDRASELETERRRAQELSGQLDAARARATELNGRIASELSARRAAEERVRALARELEAARRERDATQTALTRVRERVARLADAVRATAAAAAESETVESDAEVVESTDDDAPSLTEAP